MYRFSVVISTYNRAATLGRTLRSLRYQRHPAVEVIVVDGPSTDATAEVLWRQREWIRSASCPEANISKSRNIGIALAAGDLVAFIDDDAVPEFNWLQELDRQYAADPRLGGVGGFVRDHTGVAWQCRHIVCDRAGDARFLDALPDAGLAGRPGGEHYVSLIGVNSTFRRSALLEIGGFDEEYAYFLDETDVCLRLFDAGWSVRQVPAAEVYHGYAPSHLRDQRRVPTSLLATTRSKVYFCMRHTSPAMPERVRYDRALAVRRGVRDQAVHFLGTGQISRQHHDSLLADADRGFAEGIADSFAHPRGRLLACPPAAAADFKPQPPLRPAAERLRLILVSQDYPPRVCGGVGVFIHALARGLAAEGHEISVITRSAAGHTVDFEDGVWVHRIAAADHRGRVQPPLPPLPDSVRNHAYDVFDEAIRIQEVRGASTTLASIWDLETAACVASDAFANIIYLVTTYGLSLPSKPEWRADPHYLEHHVGRMVDGERWIIERAERVIASTPGIRRDVAELAGLPAVHGAPVIPFGLAESPLSVSPSRTEGRMRVLFVGRLEPRKGIDVFLEAAARLLGRRDDVAFEVVGDDRILVEGMTVRERFLGAHPAVASGGRLVFRGLVDDDALQRAYAACDVFVAPSRYESFGLIFLEAMRCGKPCIGTRVGGIPDVVDESCGILVPPGDAAALEAAIDALVASPERRRQLGEGGRRAFEERFSLPRFIAAVAEQAALVGRP